MTAAARTAAATAVISTGYPVPIPKLAPVLRTIPAETRPPREPDGAAATARALLTWSAASTATVMQMTAQRMRGDRTAGGST
jgi:hypothetical protein